MTNKTHEHDALGNIVAVELMMHMMLAHLCFDRPTLAAALRSDMRKALHEIDTRARENLSAAAHEQFMNGANGALSRMVGELA